MIEMFILLNLALGVDILIQAVKYRLTSISIPQECSAVPVIVSPLVDVSIKYAK